MNAKHLIWCLTVASLVTPASVSVVRAQAQKQASHESHAGVRGPLPEAVRRAIERFRDVNDAIAAGYVQNGGCVSGPEEGAMGVHFALPRPSTPRSMSRIPRCWSTNRKTGDCTWSQPSMPYLPLPGMLPTTFPTSRT